MPHTVLDENYHLTCLYTELAKSYFLLALLMGVKNTMIPTHILPSKCDWCGDITTGFYTVNSKVIPDCGCDIFDF